MNKTEYPPILYYKFSERLAVAAASYFNKLDLVLGTKIYELDKLVLKAPLWFRKNFEKSSYKTDGIPLEVLLKFKSRNDLIKMVKKPMEKVITKHLLDADKKEFSDIEQGSFLDKQEINEIANNNYNIKEGSELENKTKEPKESKVGFRLFGLES